MNFRNIHTRIVLAVAIYLSAHILGAIIYSDKSVTYYHNLTSTIENNEKHEDLIEVLRKATNNDIVIIRIAGYGGSVVTATNLVNAIQNSEAHVIAKITSGAYSAHAIIASAADERIFMPGSFIMFHTVQVPTGWGQRALLYPEFGPDLRRMVDYCYYEVASSVLSKEQADNVLYKDYEYYVYKKDGKLVYDIVKNQPELDTVETTTED